MSEEEFEKAMKLLRSLQKDLSEEQRNLAKILANYLNSAIKQNQDYEGRQYFFIENYSRRN